MSNTPKPRRTLADVYRAAMKSKPGRDLAGIVAGGFASGLVDLVDVGKVAAASTNVLRVRCTCGVEAAAPAPELERSLAARLRGPATAGAALTVGELGAFVAIHGEHGPVTVTTRAEDGTTSDNELSPELASFAGGAARGILSGSLARAAHSAAQLALKRITETKK